jgi:hypothetical protein
MPAERKRRQSRRPKPDGRRWIVRRSKQLADIYRQRLGEEVARDALLAAAVIRAAELTAYAESLRQAALRGQPISADDVVRAERLASAAVRHLQLDRPREKARGPSLKEYIASKRSASAGDVP